MNRAFLGGDGRQTLYVSFRLKHMEALLKDDDAVEHSQRRQVCHARDSTDQGSNIKSGLILN